ncbi:hypothetical protein CHCC20335_0387 [Bacillus paralicheniformis]|nr:hypothetical protein CHCC20335_0387 [Bacillus paralicheniformis]
MTRPAFYFSSKISFLNVLSVRRTGYRMKMKQSTVDKLKSGG